MSRNTLKTIAAAGLALAALLLVRLRAGETPPMGPFASAQAASKDEGQIPIQYPGSPRTAATSSGPPVVVVPDSDIVVPLKPERFATATVGSRKVATQVLTNGTVNWDVTRAVPVNCFSNGRAIEVRHRLGDDVVKDEVLLVVDSPDLADALNNYRAACSSVELKRKALERARRLYAVGVGALKDLEQATDDLRQATLTRDVSAEHIRIIGGDPEQKKPIVTIKAPVPGSIVEQNIQRGAAVKSLDASPNLFTIADLGRIWVLCDLYENNLPDVAVGDTAEVTLVAYPDRHISARVAQISKVLDPNSRTAKVRLELENKDGIFRPGMYAAVKFTSNHQVTRPIVPATAVLRLHDKCWVFRKESDARYRRVEIAAGPLLPDGMQEIEKGIGAHETVIRDALSFATTAEEEKDQK